MKQDRKKEKENTKSNDIISITASVKALTKVL